MKNRTKELGTNYLPKHDEVEAHTAIMRGSEVSRQVVCISSGRLSHEATSKTIGRF
jgi:hypothetical protein